MKFIDELIEKVMDEIDGAEEYAEQYIIYRANNNSARASQFREMATQELHHATILRDYAIQDVEAIKKIHSLSEDEEERWEKCLKKMNERISVLHYTLSK